MEQSRLSALSDTESEEEKARKTDPLLAWGYIAFCVTVAVLVVLRGMLGGA